MYDNPYVLLFPLLDSSSTVVLDSSEREIEGRLYSGILAEFVQGVPSIFGVYDKLYDNNNKGFDSTLKDWDFLHSKDVKYSTEPILDSNNRPIDCTGLFVTKS